MRYPTLLFVVALLTLTIVVPAPVRASTASACPLSVEGSERASCLDFQDSTPPGFAATTSSTSPPGQPVGPGLARLELALFELTNAERARFNVPPVEFAPTMLPVARERAAAQLTPAPLTHLDAAGRVVFADLLGGAGVGYRLAGENLARYVANDPNVPERVMQALMASAGHRENILQPAYDRLAIGVETDAAGRLACAQIFVASADR